MIETGMSTINFTVQILTYQSRLESGAAVPIAAFLLEGDRAVALAVLGDTPHCTEGSAIDHQFLRALLEELRSNADRPGAAWNRYRTELADASFSLQMSPPFTVDVSDRESALRAMQSCLASGRT